MSSVGQAVGGIVGAVVGFFTAGPGGAVSGMMRGAGIGLSIGGALDPPKGPNVVGPRLTDLSTQTSTYGTSIPRIYGTIATQGNVFWIQGDSLTEVTTVKKQKGGKGGSKSTVTSYSYFATFAVGLCQGPIAGVRRIWVGADLFYDAGGDDIGTIIASNASASLFRVYTGTETQTPDPRMQADKGAANTPAYRGLAYIAFYDLPLKDHGNSLMGAQVKVEVMKTQTSGFQVVQEANTTVSGSSSCSNNESSEPIVWIRDGYNVKLGAYLVSGNSFVLLGSIPNPTTVTQSTGVSDYPCMVSCKSTSSYDYIFYRWNGRILQTEFTLPVPGNIYGLCHYYGGGESLYVSTQYRKCIALIDADSGLVKKYAEPPYFYVGLTKIDDKLYAARGSPNNGLIDVYNASSLEYESTLPMMPGLGVGTVESIYKSNVIDGLVAVNLAFKAFRFDFIAGSWEVLEADIRQGKYSWKNDQHVYYDDRTRTAKILARGLSPYARQFITVSNVVASSTAQLSDILKAECALSGLLNPADLDTSTINKEVRGYRISETGAIRGALEPLQGAFPFDVIQRGYKIAFVPRGGVSVLMIDQSELGAVAAGASPVAQLTTSREMDSQLPRRVSIKYFDSTREYDISEQYAERLSTKAINQLDMTMPIVMTATEAAGVAQSLLYLYWLERYDVSFTLPSVYSKLEPGDIITVTGAAGVLELRLTAINYQSGGLVECKAKYSNSAVYTPTAVGEEGSSQGGILAPSGSSIYTLLDLPCLLDAFDVPGFGAAMCGVSAGWKGGVIFRSSDQGQTWADLAAFGDKVPMGFTTTLLPATGRLDIVDNTSQVIVSLIAGDLYSVTHDQMLNGANTFAIGADGRWEIVSAQNCVLNVDGTYTLSDMLRGRFGTEWAIWTHTSSDTVILLTDEDIAFIGIEASAIGQERLYRGITSGADLDSDYDRAFRYAGVNLRPLSPVYLNGSRASSNDWSLSWIRRSRVDAGLRDGVDAALAEETQAYEVEIYANNTYATIKRTLTTTTPAAAYTSADQITDFGTNQSTLYVKIYQLSAQVGRGYPLTTSITR